MESAGLSMFIYLDALTGAVFLLVGFLMNRFPPREINSFYGYRSAKSMKSQEAWDFAQAFSSKLMMKSGLFLVAFGLLGYYSLDISFFWESTLATSAFILGIGVVFYLTEKELKRIP
ncbi:SdpI family protein [Mesonia sp.]|uniref:SdpI family protein n=2 Tax=Mesonia sp. TaxID=1960830 RepID=UPI003F99FA49